MRQLKEDCERQARSITVIRNEAQIELDRHRKTWERDLERQREDARKCQEDKMALQKDLDSLDRNLKSTASQLSRESDLKAQLDKTLTEVNSVNFQLKRDRD